MSAPYQVRQACPEDVPAIAALIKPFVAQKVLRPRNEEELAALVQNGFTAEQEGRLVGFACIEIFSRKLAELLCLAVSPEVQGYGVGKDLVRRCVARAQEHHITELMVISASEQFMLDCGFHFALPGQKKAFFMQTQDPHAAS